MFLSLSLCVCVPDAEFLQTFNEEIDGVGEDDELQIPEVLPPYVGLVAGSESRAHALGCLQELEELRKQWGTTFDPQALCKLFEFLLARRVKKHKYRFAEIFD
jgi:hypothetical protein